MLNSTLLVCTKKSSRSRCPPKLGVALHCRPAIDAGLDDSEPLDDTVVVLAGRFECLGDEPLIGMRSTDVRPPHAYNLTGDPDIEQINPHQHKAYKDEAMKYGHQEAKPELPKRPAGTK